MVVAMDIVRKSTDTLEPLTYRKFAEDVKALADNFKIEENKHSGWSDGGNTGLNLQ